MGGYGKTLLLECPWGAQGDVVGWGAMVKRYYSSVHRTAGAAESQDEREGRVREQRGPAATTQPAPPGTREPCHSLLTPPLPSARVSNRDGEEGLSAKWRSSRRRRSSCPARSSPAAGRSPAAAHGPPHGSTQGSRTCGRTRVSSQLQQGLYYSCSKDYVTAAVRTISQLQ